MNTNRTHRHSPWFALLAAFVVVLGLLVPAANADAAKYPYSAPPELSAVNSAKTSVELFWRTVTGAPGYRVRAVGGGQTLYQNTGSDGTTVFKGLAPSTSYTFNVAVLQVTDGKQLSAWSKAKATRATTAATMLEPPTDLKMTKQTPNTLTLSWTPPAGFDPAAHAIRVDYAEDQAMTTGNGSQFFSGNSGTLNGLSTNTNFFVRATVVGITDHAQVGDRSTAVLAKTLSPIGWIHGTVTGAPDAAFANYSVAAYSVASGDVNQQVNLTKKGSSWEYTLQVRPGGYYVQVVNVGPANYTSLWAKSGADGALIQSQGTQVSVAMGGTTEAPAVTVGKGTVLKGQIDCPGQGTKDSCSIDVSALLDGQVVAANRSDSSGKYEIAGLPAATYTVRTNHAEDRFVAAKETVAVAGDSVTYNHTMAKRDFLTTYKVKFVKKGKVLKWSSRAYLAAVLPTERADNNDFQWYRNGSPISGATGSSWRISGGGKIKLCVRYGRFGFHTASWACSSAKKV